MNNNFFFGNKDENNFPRVKRPEHCGKDCIHFNHCHFPKHCPTLEKDRREAERQAREHI